MTDLLSSGSFYRFFLRTTWAFDVLQMEQVPLPKTFLIRESADARTSRRKRDGKDTSPRYAWIAQGVAHAPVGPWNPYRSDIKHCLLIRALSGFLSKYISLFQKIVDAGGISPHSTEATPA